VRMGKPLFGCAFALAVGVVSCGGSPVPQAPDLGSLPIATPAHDANAKSSAPTALARPENVIAWIRVDDFDGILDLAGVSAQSLAANPMLSEILPYYETIEPHRPIDVIVLATGKRAKDVDVAARFGLRDAKGFFRAVSKHYDVSEKGDRVIVRKQTPHSARPEDEEEEAEGEVVMVCDLAGTAAERATCGSQAAMDSVSEWLRGGPEPRPEDSVRTGKGGSMARAVLYGSALRKVLAANVPRRDDATEKSLFDLLEDIDVVSIDLAREDKELSFVFGTRLRSASSTIAKQMLSKPNDEKPGDPFFRIWQSGSAVVFIPGGGALPTWASFLTDSFGSHSHDESSGDPSNAAKAIGKVLEKPVTIGYGVRLDQAKTALSAVRAAKDPEKAMTALERALEPYLVYSVSADPAVVERAMKDLATSWTSSSEEYGKKYSTSYPVTRHVVRAAPAKLGLPKGSFFFDTTSADWRHSVGSSSGAGGGVKTKTEHIVHVPVGNATWGLTCLDEKACVEGAKKLLAPGAAPKRSLDSLFERKGIAFAGYLSSLVGAFTMHRVSLGSPSGGVPNDVLVEIEHDLASPRLELPFVVTTERDERAGGNVAFEMRGDRDAFKMLGEHAGLGSGSGLGILVYAAMMLRH
jgi:hypothetical protein